MSVNVMERPIRLKDIEARAILDGRKTVLRRAVKLQPEVRMVDMIGPMLTFKNKRGEYPAGAHSTCTYGVQPDTDFDRYQWSPARLWEVVFDVLSGRKVTP